MKIDLKKISIKTMFWSKKYVSKEGKYDWDVPLYNDLSTAWSGQNTVHNVHIFELYVCPWHDN